MTKHQPNKVRVIQTDEGYAFIHDDDLIEGGTPEEVAFKVMRKVAKIRKAMKDSLRMPAYFFVIDEIAIGLN